MSGTACFLHKKRTYYARVAMHYSCREKYVDLKSLMLLDILWARSHPQIQISFIAVNSGK